MCQKPEEIVGFLTQDHLAPHHLRRSHSTCDAVAAREGRIFKRLHHPVDTRYTMAKDNGDGSEDWCQAKNSDTAATIARSPTLLYELQKLDKVFF